MPKIDKSKLRKIDTSTLGIPKPADGGPGKKSNATIKTKKKGLKKSKLQKKKDNTRSKYWKTKAMAMWGKFQHHINRSCIVCGTTENLNAHHLISRSNVMLRNHPENCAMLCVNHHNFDNKISAHQAPLGFIRFLEKERPEMIEFMEENQNLTGVPDYKNDYEILEALLRDAGGE